MKRTRAGAPSDRFKSAGAQLSSCRISATRTGNRIAGTGFSSGSEARDISGNRVENTTGRPQSRTHLDFVGKPRALSVSVESESGSRSLFCRIFATRTRAVIRFAGKCSSRRSDREARSAAARRRRRGVHDLEHPAHQIVLEVDLAAAQKLERDLVHENGRAVTLHDDVVVRAFGRDIIGIGESRAPTAVDPDPQARAGRLGLHDLRYAPRRSLGEFHWRFRRNFAHCRHPRTWRHHSAQPKQYSCPQLRRKPHVAPGPKLASAPN